MVTTGLTLDAGALIGIERGEAWTRTVLRRARASSGEIHTLPEVIAQVWRGGPRQARLAAFLAESDVEVRPYDELAARAVGQLCGKSGHDDVVDVHVVLHARMHRHAVVTSDPDDLAKVDPSLPLIVV